MRLSSDGLNLLYDLGNTFGPVPLRSTTRFSHQPQRERGRKRMVASMSSVSLMLLLLILGQVVSRHGCHEEQ